MNLVARVVVPVAVLALAFGAARDVHAADAPAVVAQVEAHNKAFLAAYEAGSLSKMKSESGKAVALGEKNGLTTNAIMADTYVLAAILEVDGKENAAAGTRDFVKALKIRADVAIPKGMATSPVKAAFKQARIDAGLAPKEGAVAATPESAPKAQDPTKVETKVETKAETKVEKAKDEPAKETVAAKEPVSKDSAKLEARVQQLEQQLTKDKADRDKQLADAKARNQQLEQQLADVKSHDKQSDKDEADRDRQLADVRSRAQQSDKDKADRDKQLADAKVRNQQLEQQVAQLVKEKADRDKQLALAQSREGKEREAREKIEHERQIAEAKEKDAATKRQQEQQSRERLFAGPPMPGHLTEALHCEVPDEAPLRTDLFVHCVARPSVKARSIVFYYRAGTARYTSVTMERTSKGWYAALVPGAHVVGKAMQYYAEALDGREAVVATNGKEASPNILTLRAGIPRG